MNASVGANAGSPGLLHASARFALTCSARHAKHPPPAQDTLPCVPGRAAHPAWRHEAFTRTVPGCRRCEAGVPWRSGQNFSKKPPCGHMPTARPSVGAAPSAGRPGGISRRWQSGEARSSRTPRSLPGLKPFQIETRCTSNHAACRLAGTTRCFRSVWAGRRCASAFFKGKTL